MATWVRTALIGLAFMTRRSMPPALAGGYNPKVGRVDVRADLGVINGLGPEQLHPGEVRNQPEDLARGFDQEVRARTGEHGAVRAEAYVRVSGKKGHRIEEVLLGQRHAVCGPFFQLSAHEQPLVEGEVEPRVGRRHRRDQLAVLGHYYRDVPARVVLDLGL